MTTAGPPPGVGRPAVRLAVLNLRVLEEGPSALDDLDILEALLLSGEPGRCARATAEALLRRFGSVAEVLDARPEALAAVPGVAAGHLAAFEMVRWWAARLGGEPDRPEDDRSPQDYARA